MLYHYVLDDEHIIDLNLFFITYQKMSVCTVAQEMSNMYHSLQIDLLCLAAVVSQNEEFF